MKIKRYLVKSMPEALEAIRRDLGPEAVIISSRKVRAGSWWHFFAPPKLEVTAAVDTYYPSPQERPGGEPGALRGEIEEIKRLLQQARIPPEKEGKEEKPLLFQKWRDSLLELEVSKELTAEILKALGKYASWEALPEEVFEEALVAQVAALLNPPLPLRKVTGFVGPTGVGKTTTIAKLAARLALFEHKKVGLITIDTYRIGAVEQLKTYGEIMGVPVATAMSPKELKEAVRTFEAQDVILIDTTGRPSHDAVRMQELRGFLEPVEDLTVCLVLSCTTRSRDLFRAVEDYRAVGYSQLVFTKLDETSARGVILEVARRTRQPVAYITNGQNVPDDLEKVDPEKLARLILGVATRG